MNLFALPAGIHREEITDILWETDALRVERIVSCGQASPEGFWYDQEEDEWVCLLTGEADLEYETGVQTLRAGDCVFLPRHRRHRVARTTACVWLCVFIEE